MNSDIQKQIETNLKRHLFGACGFSDFSEVLNYGVLPAGKLFRPKLAAASFLDSLPQERLNGKPSEQYFQANQCIALIASALEIHHAYTLIHDDLPCMDDDDYRRGRESTHKKFGQWQAVLAGDALLHHSHQLIGKCKSSNHYSLRAIFNWALGAKGLVLGQVFDLSGLINSSFENLLRTHELKTGRLIQTSLLAGKWAAKDLQSESLSFTDIKSLMRLGSHIGIVFQLFDDLSEMSEPLSGHELQVNPFLKFPEQSLSALKEGLKIIAQYQGAMTTLVLREYFNKMKKLLTEDISSEESHIKRQIDSIEHFETIKSFTQAL